MFNFSVMENAIRIIKQGALSVPSERQFIAHEIAVCQMSEKWKWKVRGDDYYNGRHDILQKKRHAIGDGGQLIEVTNLPNNKQIDNVYRRMVKQKTNYLFGKPFSVTSDDQAYQDALTYVFAELPGSIPIMMSRVNLSLSASVHMKSSRNGRMWITLS